MKRLTTLCLLALVAACGGESSGSPTTSTVAPSVSASVDRAAVDDAIQRTIDSARTLTHLKGGIYDTIAQYRQAATDLQVAVGYLTPPPAGVDVGTVRDAVADLTVLKAAIEAVADCYESEADSLGADGGSCDHAGNRMSRVAFKAGQAVSLLAEYGSVSAATIEDRLHAAVTQ